MIANFLLPLQSTYLCEKMVEVEDPLKKWKAYYKNYWYMKKIIVLSLALMSVSAFAALW